MATIGRANGAAYNNTSRLSYISTEPYFPFFFSYSTVLTASLETVGTLTPVAGGNFTTCPGGRVLRENGRKLYPGANPGITTYMVGVYDSITLLSGFIDPNSRYFQIYNTDKPNFLPNGVAPPNDNTVDLGPPVLTRGNVSAQGDLDISGSARIYGSTYMQGDLEVDGTLDVSGSAAFQSNVGIVGVTTHSNHVNISLGDLRIETGKLYLNSFGTNRIVSTIRMGTAPTSNNGGFLYQIVSNSAVTTDSYVFLTNRSIENAGGVYSVENIVPGTSFQIISNNLADTSLINYLIIN
jgi:hypothetical protein